jgi:hypothetical protein
MYRDAANSHYNALQASIKSQAQKDLTLQGAYTYASAIDSTSNNGNGWDLNDIPNPYNRNYGVGPAAFNRRHVFVANFIYDLPLFRNARSRAMRIAAGGWQISGYVTAETGLPINIQLGGPAANNGLPTWNGAGPGGNRPNVAGPIATPHTLTTWFDPKALSAPALGAYGNLGFDSLYGPGRHNWNLSVFKSFVLSEARGSRFELRVESFNTFNHTQFQNVSTNYSSGNFGQITSVFDPRAIQLGAKLYF